MAMTWRMEDGGGEKNMVMQMKKMTVAG